MKNSKWTYLILIPLVLFIWGVIVYKIVSGDNLPSKKQTVIHRIKSEDVETPETSYQLLMNYPDPFFKTKQNVGHQSQIPKKISEKVVVKQHWPPIKLNGYMSNGAQVKCHLSIDGESKILAVQDEVTDGFFISKITPDSVEISHKGRYCWFKKL